MAARRGGSKYGPNGRRAGSWFGVTARPAGKTPEEEIESKNITTASEVSEAEIAVHWQEEGYYHPPATFIAHANLTDAALHKRFSLAWRIFPNASSTRAAPRLSRRAASIRPAAIWSYVAGTSKYIQDIHPEDVYWCMADIGWIAAHSYIVYGPLALAASSVVYEGVPTYPDAGRPWRIAEELGVNTKRPSSPDIAPS
ncbi:MAG TPA: hypothetical protein VEF72_01685 [Mycobacterium sp.]|nr:hypothetical protein [Mycobacterium sp.]